MLDQVRILTLPFNLLMCPANCTDLFSLTNYLLRSSVLVLSYKNHALDEFLIDVIKLSKASNLRIGHKGNLIRAGKPERLAELGMYSEK